MVAGQSSRPRGGDGLALPSARLRRSGTIMAEEETSSAARSGAGPADLAAEQVESIVAAAQEAAEEIRKQAKLEVQEGEKRANQDADTIRAEARRDATRELDSARRKAARLGEDARQEANTLLEESRAEANELREHTRQEVAGRVEGAEQAAEEVLAEARALSTGLRRLGQSLGEQAERILRDVQAAHQRMRADLRAPVPERDDFELPSRASRGRTHAGTGSRDLEDDRTFELPTVDDAPSARRSSSPARRSSGSARRGTTRPPERSSEPARREREPDPEPRSEPGEAEPEAQPFDAETALEDDAGDGLDVPSWLGGDRPA
jgi:cell division septum initiation protein DivIVA